MNERVHLAKAQPPQRAAGTGQRFRRRLALSTAAACLLMVPACRHGQKDKTDLSKAGRTELEAAFKTGPSLDPRCDALLPPEDARLLTLTPTAASSKHQLTSAPSSPPLGEVSTKSESRHTSATTDALPTGPPAAQTSTPPRPLVQALIAYLEQHPDDAVKCLQGYDPKDQELVLRLLPLLAQVDQYGLLGASGNGAEKLAWLAALRSLDLELRARAPLVVDKLTLCRHDGVEAFGQVRPLPSRQLRAGDRVLVYAEIQNLVDRRGPDGLFSVRLSSTLEVRGPDGKLAAPRLQLRATPNGSWSPRNDFFVRIFFPVPPDLAPGFYTLVVQLTDEDTARPPAEQHLSFQVVASTATAKR